MLIFIAVANIIQPTNFFTALTFFELFIITSAFEITSNTPSCIATVTQLAALSDFAFVDSALLDFAFAGFPLSDFAFVDLAFLDPAFADLSFADSAFTGLVFLGLEGPSIARGSCFALTTHSQLDTPAS